MEQLEVVVAPPWEQVVREPERVYPYVARMDTRGQRIERCLLGDEVIPVVLIRAEGFRSELTERTQVQLVMDLVTVFPRPTPIVYVLAVIFDDVEDPFFRSSAIFPVPPQSMHGTPILPEEVAAMRARTRSLLRCFLRTSRSCGLVVIDRKGDVLLHRVVTVDHGAGDGDAARNEEIRDAIDFLDGFEMARDYADLEAVNRAFESVIWIPIRCPDGVYRSIPPGRSTVRVEDAIFSIQLSDGRLVDRRPRDSLRPARFEYDLFISHAHTDADAVQAIRQWLVGIYPSLRISVTNENAEAEFRADPRYFLMDSLRAACVLYVATENSVARPMVQNEISHNAHKPILTLTAGRISRADIEAEIRSNPFIRLDSEQIFDLNTESGWTSLAEQLEILLDARPEGEALPAPTLSIPEDDLDPARRAASYRSDWRTIARAFSIAQSREQAGHLVAEEAQRLHEAGHIDQPPEDLDPEGLLAMILSVTQRALVPQIMDCFPALVNDYLVQFARELARRSAGLPDEERIVEQMLYIADCAHDRANPVDPEVVETLVEQLVWCESRADARRLALQHPKVFLSHEADRAITRMLDVLVKSPDDSDGWRGAVQRLAGIQNVLRIARRDGIEVAFADP